MAYSLTLYVYPSPRGVDWRSPHHLTKSVVVNSLTFKPRTIGHVSIHLSGPNESDMAGMSALNKNDNKKKILIENMGLGVLFYGVPGCVEDLKKLEPELHLRLEGGHFSFIRFEISKESYARAKQYLDEYRAQNKGSIYGLPFRPRYSEGAGCSAFAASFLEVAGLMQPEFQKHWSSTVRVPEEYIGTRSQESAIRKVSILSLLIPSKKNLKWAESKDAGRDIFFWDPDMMHQWILKKWASLQHSSTKSEPALKAVTEKNTKGILIDASKIIPTNDPIWL